MSDPEFFAQYLQESFDELKKAAANRAPVKKKAGRR